MSDDMHTEERVVLSPEEHKRVIEEIYKQLEQEIPVLRRFARALVGSPDKADDLVQDTLERALSRIDTFTPGTNLRAWLFTILRNNHINSVRRSRMTAEPPETIESLMPPMKAVQEHGLSIRDLERGLAKLSADMREVVLLVGLEGMSYEEAAEILDVKVGTVKSRLCRGREALRRYMESANPDPHRLTAERLSRATGGVSAVGSEPARVLEFRQKVAASRAAEPVLDEDTVEQLRRYLRG